jgi:hypothetical protein
MPYRAPGTYARFVRTAGPVNNPGTTRIMGLIGTGLKYFEIYNEAIQRSSNKPYDVLANPNVIEISSISDKPVYLGKTNPDNKIYEENINFYLKDGQNIKWEIMAEKEPAVKVTSTGTTGSDEFFKKITATVDDVNEHLVQDGTWVIEITYIDETGEGSGAYRVINYDTKEILGEYETSSKARHGAIPGTLLTITDTRILGADDDVVTAIGDYVLVTTTAGKTESEPTYQITVPTTNGWAELKSCITNVTINYPNYVIDNDYTITVEDVTNKLFTIAGKDDQDPTKTKTYYDSVAVSADKLILPGISFTFDHLPTVAVDEDGNPVAHGTTVTLKTTARQLYKAPAEGNVYYVSYKYSKAAIDYDPKIFFDYDDIVAEYGNYDVTATGVIINSLSLGAEIAFQNGVVPVVCVQAESDRDYDMKKAIDKLQRTLPGVNNVNTIIPLTESANVGAYAVKHVDLMSSEDQGKERMTYLGASRNQVITKNPSALDMSIGMVETAQSYANERVIYVVPGEIVKEVKDLRTGRVNNRVLPACYAAVAVAALGLVNDPAEPLTNKTIAGFKSLTRTFTESEKNFLAGAGCLILEQRGSIIKVRHGITTSNVDVNSTEITLIQIKDYVIDACRQATAALYIGNKNRPSIISDVQYTITNILNQFISQEIILGFNGLSVKRNSNDPRQVDVRFEIEAVYPLNYIGITFGFAAVS